MGEGDKEVHLSPWCYNFPCERSGVFDLVWSGGVDITGSPLGCRSSVYRLYRYHIASCYLCRLFYLSLTCLRA